jgi:hypothetical protein
MRTSQRSRRLCPPVDGCRLAEYRAARSSWPSLATERLGTSDLAIIAVRRRLLEAAKAMRERGVVPGEISDPASYAVRSDALLLPAEQPWFEATAERRQVLVGANPDCA